jgi:hypothetical protein
MREFPVIYQTLGIVNPAAARVIRDTHPVILSVPLSDRADIPIAPSIVAHVVSPVPSVPGLLHPGHSCVSEVSSSGAIIHTRAFLVQMSTQSEAGMFFVIPRKRSIVACLSVTQRQATPRNDECHHPNRKRSKCTKNTRHNPAFLN